MESNQIAFLNKEQSGQVIQSRFHASEVRQLQTTVPGADSPLSNSRRAGYGLPCRNCKAYYAANVISCPYCGCMERASSVATNAPQTAAVIKKELRGIQAEIPDAPSRAILEESGNTAVSDEDRERVLHAPSNPAAAFRCIVEMNHMTEYQLAAVCTSCYTEATERLQQLEAALCIDLREAAQLIYDAVWSDPSPSDPSRTYKNAAEAVLSEIRRRASLALPAGSLAPYAH